MQTIALMQKSKITIQDIAKALDVTPSTVSRALNNHPAISKKTKDAVIAKAKALKYTPNGIAAALRNGKSNIIGILLPVADRTFFSSVIRGIETHVANQNYGVIVCQTHNSIALEAKALDTLLRSRVDAIIASVTTTPGNLKYYQQIVQNGTPLVFFDRVIEQIGASCIEYDNFEGAYMATKHLIDQGCQKIVHFHCDLNLKIYQDRLSGYKKALEDHQIKIDPQLIFGCESEVQEGMQIAKKLHQQKILFDGLFSASDYAALGAMQFLKKAGLDIPNDVAIIGFANESFTEFLEPSMSSVDLVSLDMGTRAAQICMDHLSQSRSPQTIKLSPKLVLRNSSIKAMDRLS